MFLGHGLDNGGRAGVVGSFKCRRQPSWHYICYVEAPSGTVVVGGDPGGGAQVRELRISEGRTVKKGDILAVLSQFPIAETTLRQSEAQLAKVQLQRQAMIDGYRITEIRQQEIAIEAAIERGKLKEFELDRSSMPADARDLELKISQRQVDRQRLLLQFLKAKLQMDMAINAADIEILAASVESARLDREAAIVRAPIDGVVVQIQARASEYVDPKGLFTIVDLQQLRVLADINELHLGRVAPGGKVELTFRGSPSVHKGTIIRVAQMVKRMQMGEAPGGSSPDARLVEVEIQFDDLTNVPALLHREVRVTFL